MAVPHPEDELLRLRKAIGKGLPAVTVVTGAGDFFRAEAMELLLAAVPEDAELRLVDAVEERAAGGGAEASAGGAGDEEEGAADGSAGGAAACAELQDLRGGGLFARRSFVCIRRGSNWWKNHAVALAAQAPKFQAGCGLLLEAAKLDKRKKAAATFCQGLTDKGALFEFRDLYDLPYDRSRSPTEGELCKWVVGRGSKLGVPLLPEAAWLLVVQVGKSPMELMAELGRLRDQLGPGSQRKPLSPADLRGKLTCSFESDPFEFAAAVLGGDRRTAMRSVHAMFDRGVRNKDGKRTDAGGVLPFTTSWLYQAIANVYEGRILLDGGVSPRDLPGRLGVRQFTDRFVEHVQKNDVRRLQRGLLAVHHCQRMSRLSAEEPAVLLERLLAQWFDGGPIPMAKDLEP